MDWLMLSNEWDGNQAWVQSAAEGLGWGILLWAAVAGTILILAPLAGATVSRRRRFWCNRAGGAVEVEFEEYRLAGRQGAVAVAVPAVDQVAADAERHGRLDVAR